MTSHPPPNASAPPARSALRSVEAAGAVLLGVLAGCRSRPEPEPLAPPPLELRVEHYAGSPLAGPTELESDGAEQGATGPLEEAWIVDCRVLFLEHMPVAELQPLAARTRLIAASRGDRPVLSSAVLATGARVGVGEEATDFIQRLERGELGRTLDLADPVAALPVGVSALFEATAQDFIVAPDLGEIQKVVGLHVSRETAADEAPAAVLVVEDLAPPSSVTGEEEAGTREALRRELICLDDRPPVDDGPLVLMLPSPFLEGRGALIAVVRATKGEPREGTALTRDEVLARCAADLERRAAEPVASTDRSALVRTISSAFRALDVARYHRPSLLFLAANTGAELVEDLALSADDGALSAYVRAVVKANGDLDSLERTDDPARTGWLLESEAYLFLARLQLEEPPLAPELLAVLLRHAGEVGRFPSLVREIVGQCHSLEGLRERWVAENRIFLDDSSPSARVRALDWLTVRGRAPEGFDPLADATERRKALVRAREADAAPPEERR